MKHLLDLANALYSQWLDISLRMQAEQSEFGMVPRSRDFMEQFERLGKEARQQYEAFFKMGGEDATAFAQYADLSVDKPDVCLDYVRRAIRLNEREPLANYMLGQLRTSEGDHRQAIAHFQTAVDGAQTDPVYQEELGKLCFLTWRPQKTDADLLECAVRAYEAAVRLRPQNNNYLLSLVVVLHEGGRSAESKKRAQEYVARDMTSRDAGWIFAHILNDK